MKDRVREDAPELYGLWNLLAKHNPMNFYPSKVEFHSQQAFGKNNPLKLYTGLPVISQIAVIVWKLGYLRKSEDEPKTLAEALSCGEIILVVLGNLARVFFWHLS